MAATGTEGHELLEHIEKPQVPGGTWGCLWDSCSEGAGNRGLFDHHLLTIDDVQTLGGSDDALAGDVVDGLAGGLTIGDVVNAGVEWSLNPADGRLTNLVATVVDALNTYLCPTFEDGSVVVEVDAVGVVP